MLNATTMMSYGPTENPDGSALAEEFQTTLVDILQKERLSPEDYEAVRGAVVLLQFATNCVLVGEGIPRPMDNDFQKSVSTYDVVVKSDGNMQLDTSSTKVKGKSVESPLIVGAKSIRKLFAMDFISQRGELQDLQQSRKTKKIPKDKSENLKQQLLEKQTLARLEESIHIRHNSLKLSDEVCKSLAKDFLPVDFHNLVLTVNAYLMRLIVERYGVE